MVVIFIMQYVRNGFSSEPLYFDWQEQSYGYGMAYVIQKSEQHFLSTELIELQLGLWCKFKSWEKSKLG